MQYDESLVQSLFQTVGIADEELMESLNKIVFIEEDGLNKLRGSHNKHTKEFRVNSLATTRNADVFQVPGTMSHWRR